MSSQMLSGARSMSILSPTKEENASECPDHCPDPERLSRLDSSSRTAPRLSEQTQTFLGTPKESTPNILQFPRLSSPKPLIGSTWQPCSPDNPGSSKCKVSDAKDKAHSMSVTRTPSSQVTEHKIEEHPSPIELKDSAQNKRTNGEDPSPQEHEFRERPTENTLRDPAPPTKPRYIFKQARLMGPRGPESPTLRQSQPDITLSRVPSLGQTTPVMSALRRISASEPGLRPGNRPDVPVGRSIRHSKSSFIESDSLKTIEQWRTSRDPLARVSVADDLASLAALAHVLEEEPLEAKLNSDASGKHAERQFDAITSQNIENRLPRLIQELEKTKRTLTKAESDLAKLAREVTDDYAKGTLTKAKYESFNRCMGEFAHIEVSLNTKDARPVQISIESPEIIVGPDTLRSGDAQSPEKESVAQNFGTSASLTIVKSTSPVVVSAKNVSVDVQGGNIQKPADQSPRLSVRALAAKFNLDDSSSALAPSPTKPSSKATSNSIRPCCDLPEKIVAPYTTNPPSPAKSQKSSISNVSVRSIRIPPPDGRNVIGISPPRRTLKSDLKDSTPLHSVPKREPILLPPESPSCCSPAGSPARLSLYDGPSVQPSPDTMSPHVHFEAKDAIAAIKKAFAMSNTAESQPIPMAINSLTSPPPTRSNSLLYAQIRKLQQQLNLQLEEARHLKRKLGSRGNLDMVALSQELREAKTEIQLWKHRAEVAEKQLEIMATLTRRNSSSHAATASSSMVVGYSTSTPSRTNYGEDGAVVNNRIRRALHGADGASSLPNASERSTDTVVRDVRKEESRETDTENEGSMWVSELIERY